MSKKITKVIAALGVVAGLGVAALPLSSYAADGNASMDVTVNVQNVFTVTVPTNAGALNASVSSIAETNGTSIAHATAKVTANGAGGTYTFKIGTPYSTTVNTTALARTGYAVPLTSPDITKIIPAGTPTIGTSAWGYKLIATTSGANGAGGGAIAGATNDTTYQAPAAYTSATFEGGKTISNSAVIPTGGDNYTFQIGATISNLNVNGEYKGSLQVYGSES